MFTEGDAPDAVFLLKSGLLKSVKHGSHDESSTIDFITPSQMFGMIAVMDRKNYPVSVVALRDAELYRIPAPLFLDFMTRSPAFRQGIFRQVGNHLRNSQALRTLMQEPVERRIAHILNYLFETIGAEIPLVRADIAAMAGCTEATAIRTIINFRKKKIIETAWKHFKIVSPDKLKSLIQAE